MIPEEGLRRIEQGAGLGFKKIMSPRQCIAEELNNSSLSESLLSSNERFREDNVDDDNDDDETTIDERQEVPRNVTFVLLYTWFAFSGRGVWNQNCLATLVFLLRDGDPKSIGFITAAMGISQLCVSIPTGILADKYRRDILLKIGAFFGIVAATATIYAALHPGYLLLVGALILWGIHWGIVNTAITALFSDSIPDGERSFYFTRRAIIINFGNMCGPAIALIMFAVLGDKWTVKDCSMVLLAGNVLCLPGIILLCFLSDDLCEIENDGLEEPLLSLEVREANASTQELGSGRLSSGSNTAIRTAVTHQDETYNEERLAKALCCLPGKRIVPILVASSDIISGLASGMSIRYFAIFLYDNLGLSPVAVQMIYMMNSILQVGFRRQAQRLAGTYGRCRVTICMKWIGILLMISMVVSYKCGLPRSVVCIILILRTSFMNSPQSLTKSILMDNVPKEERGKWASLESVNMFSWSGSAALGGILVQRKGIIFNFCFTAALQLIATGPLLLLSFFDNKEDEAISTNSNQPSETGNDEEEDHDHDDDEE
ncbi:MAG: MFS family permease [Bacillariaceae sp.]